MIIFYVSVFFMLFLIKETNNSRSPLTGLTVMKTNTSYPAIGATKTGLLPVKSNYFHKILVIPKVNSILEYFLYQLNHI